MLQKTTGRGALIPVWQMCDLQLKSNKFRKQLNVNEEEIETLT